jgi:formylglycine-generating enzyme required for sulfatase activity
MVLILGTDLAWRWIRGASCRPWNKANSQDLGPFDTTPVDAFPNGVSPYGMLDPAGNVFEWTADSEGGRPVVKGGGSWDDKGCGLCRPAARHTRPRDLKHIIIGFRLVREVNDQRLDRL